MAVQVVLRYWAGARAAAHVETETMTAASVADALSQAKALRPGDAEFDRVLSLCTVLVDGRAVHHEQLGAALGSDVTAEVLPPFAGGAISNGERPSRHSRWRLGLLPRAL